MPFTAYWVVRQSQLDEQSIKQVHRFLIFLGIYLAVTGICEITQQWSFVFPRYIADSDVGIHFGRARGPFGNSVRYGLYVATCAFATWVVWKRLTPRWQIALVPLAPLFLAGVFFSYTRSVWLGMAAATLMAALLTLKGHLRTAALSLACLVGLLASIVLWDKLIHLERDESGGHAAVSVSNRAAHAYVSFAMFRDRPLLGFGFGHYPNEKLAYLQDRRTALKLQRLRTRLSHNTVLTLLVELGIIGLSLFMAVIAAWAFCAIRLWRNQNTPPWARQHAVLFLAVMCIYLTQLLFHEVTFRPDTNSLVFILAGTIVGLSTELGCERAPRVSRDGRETWRVAMEVEGA
jgi:O-antigen ligase